MATRASRVAWFLAIAVLAALPPAAAEIAATPPSGWTSPLHRDHVLAGTVWSAQLGRAVPHDQLMDTLADGEIVLLGEVHDNPDHHRLRAWLIGVLADRSRQAGKTGPAVVFEHIRADQQKLVDEFRSSPDPGGAPALLQRLDWERSGWPSATMFTPLFEEILRFDLPILGGNTPGQAIRGVAQQGLSALSDEERTRLGLDVQLEPPLHAALVSEIEASHCGLLPESVFAPMALAQQYRDAHLADVLLSARNAQGTATLIAGNGHVRADRGVPWHLRHRAPGARSMVVAFMEIDGSTADAAGYVPRDPSGEPAVDYVWFTPQSERPDPCERMRQRYKRPEAKPSGGR